MSLYRKLSRKPKLFLSVTGMNLHQFQTLLPQFESADNKCEQRRKRKVVRTGKKRLRQIGGGAQFGNSLPDRLLMLLFYYRLYLTHSRVYDATFSRVYDATFQSRQQFSV